jgi:hypothetical protein
MTRDSLRSLLSVLSSLSVGCVFLLAGLLKLLSPSAFLRHISNLIVKPMAGLPLVALVCLTGLLGTAECVLGVALLVRIFPDQVFPLSLGLLTVFAAMTLAGAFMRRTDNCGCYGNLLALTPVQSTLLTMFYAALIAVAWRFPLRGAFTTAAQTGVLIGSVGIFAGMAVVSMWSYLKFEKDLLETSPVRPHRRWNPLWLEGFAEFASRRPQLVILMSPECPVCQKWITPLNKISRRPGMPQVIVGVPAAGGNVDGFFRDFRVDFPVLPVKPGTMARLAMAFPTVVTVDDGLITSVNIGQLPPELMDQLRPHASGEADEPVEPDVAESLQTKGLARR